jgi:hypothetical protein
MKHLYETGNSPSSTGAHSSNLLLTSDYWTDLWRRQLQGYRAGPARTGRYLHHSLRGTAAEILEIAADSSRDPMFLRDKGYPSASHL